MDGLKNGEAKDLNARIKETVEDFNEELKESKEESEE